MKRGIVFISIVAVLGAAGWWFLIRPLVGPDAPRPADLAVLDPEVAELVTEYADQVDARRGDINRRFQLGLVYEGNQLYALAVRCFEQITDQYAKDPKSWYHLALCHERLGSLDAALHCAIESAKRSRDYAPVHWRLGFWHLDAGDLDAAERAANTALMIDETSEPPHLVLAAVALDRGDAEAAAERINSRNLTEGDGAPWAHAMLATISRRQGDEAALAMHLEQSGDRPGFRRDDPWSQVASKYRTGLAQLQRRAGGLVRAERYDEARSVLLEMRERGDSDIRTLNLLGVCALRMNRRANAIDWFRQAVALREDHASSRVNLATALISGTPTSQELSEAIKQAARACELDPDSDGAQRTRADALRIGGQIEAAIAAYRTAWSLDERDPAPMLRAGLLHLDREEWADADAVFTEVLERHDGYAIAWIGRARALMEQGQFDDAGRLLERAAAAAIPNAAQLQAAQERLRNLEAARNLIP